MKSFLITFVLLVATLTTQLFGQWTSNYNPYPQRSNSELVLTFAGTLDTLGGTYDSLASNSFDLEDYDSDNYFTLYYDFESTAGSPNCLIDLYISEDNSTFTRYVQLVDTTTSETPTWTRFDLTDIRAGEYKLVIEQVAPGRDNTTFTAKIRARKKDPAVTN